MISRITPTLAICTVAGAVAVIGLARPTGGTSGSDPYGTAGAAPAPSAEPDAEPDAGIEIRDFSFPESTTVGAGRQIVVTNADGVFHTLTARDGSFDTSAIDASGTFTIVAPGAPGEYAFYCTIHPSMTGTLVVEG